MASSDDWAEDDRVAWARALGVDERLTVIGAAPDGPLKLGDKIEGLQGFFRNNAEVMMEKLAELRDKSYPFSVKLSTGKIVEVRPFQVCRGYTRLASPGTPKAQDYHWLMSIHPLEVARADLSDDEALWLVLWTQGVSEEGGLRMKSYSYGTKSRARSTTCSPSPRASRGHTGGQRRRQNRPVDGRHRRHRSHQATTHRPSQHLRHQQNA